MVGRKGTDWRRAIQNDKQATKWRQKKTEKFIMYGQSAYWFYHAVMRTAEIIRWDLSMRHTTNDISSFITSFRYNFTTLDVSFELRRDDAHRFLEWMDLVEYHWYGNESSGRYDTRSFYIYLPHMPSHIWSSQLCNMIQFSVIEPFYWQIVRQNCERKNIHNNSDGRTGRKTMCNTNFCYLFSIFQK